jgi:hypothetical protein
MPRDTFTWDTIGPELVATDKRIRQAALRGLRLAARLGRGEVVKEISGNKPFPLVDLTELKLSPKVGNLPDGAVLAVTAPHGIYQEFGTGPAAGSAPFTPPFEVILEWAKRKKRRSGTRRKGKGGKTSAKKKGGAGPLDEANQWLKASRKHLAAARDLLETPEQRKRKKAKRKAAKAKREEAAAKDARAFAGAVWANMRKKGMKGKHYYARASAKFQGHVDQMVDKMVAKVRR